ncbi:MAG: HAMP domain-containing sensor histidine kinase, partial [Oscillospiraceae bacterium]
NCETEKANKNLQSLYEKAYIMLKNVNNISLAAKLSSKEELTASLVDFSSLVESAFKGAEMVLPSYVKISTEIQSGAIVKGNSALLSNGMFNLLLNSIEYKKEGNVEIQVKLKLAGDRCVLTYSDNSLGIKPTVAPFIFDFYYSHNPYDDGEKSTKLGLGLFIAKAAIENANGSFIFQSEFDGGVKYGISIPLCNNDGGDVLKSKPKDFVMNRYSEMFVQLCEYCTLPDLC